MRVKPLVHLGESVRLFRQHPVLSSAFGLSLVVSVAAVCCGLGLLAAPWFGCELYAFQIHAVSGKRPPRTGAWLMAGGFILVSALLSVAAASVSGLGLSSSPLDLANGSNAEAFEPERALVSTGGVVLSLLFIMPFTYAPRILVDRGGTLGAAAMESARFFVRDGTLRHIGLVFLSHGIQSIPFTIAVVVSLFVADPTALPLAIVIASPLLAVSVPVGQGVVTCAWVARRNRLVAPGKTRPAGRPPRLLVALVVLSFFAPPLSLALTASSLIRPSDVRAGAAPSDGEVLVDVAVGDEPLELAIPATALTVEVGPHTLAVVASDGGGAGAFPLPERTEIERVRIVRARDAYTIELGSAGGTLVTLVDRAGVRLDDDLPTRLAERLPPSGYWVLALVLLLTPLVLTNLMVHLAELRALALSPENETPDEALERARAATVRRGSFAVLALLPLGIAALCAGFVALL